MNKSSAAKKSTFFLIVLVLSFFSFSCGDEEEILDGDVWGGVRDEPTATEKEVANALRGLSLVNNAYPEFTLDFTKDGKIVVNKNASYSDPKEFVNKFYKSSPIAADDFWGYSGGYCFYYIDEGPFVDVGGEIIGTGDGIVGGYDKTISKKFSSEKDTKDNLEILENDYKYENTETRDISVFSKLRMELNLDVRNCKTNDGKIFTGNLFIPCLSFSNVWDNAEEYLKNCVKVKYNGKEYDALFLEDYNCSDIENVRIIGKNINFTFDAEKKRIELVSPELFFKELSYSGNYFDLHSDLDYDYYRLPNDVIKDDDDDTGNSGNEVGGAITLSGEYSVTGSSANVTLSFSNGTMTKKAGSGTGTATSYTYKINGKKLTITQSAGGSDITNDFTLSESNENIVVSGEKTFVFMIFGVNAETATLTRN